MGNRHARAAKLPQHRWCYETDQKSEDGDDDEDFEKRESGIGLLARRPRETCILSDHRIIPAHAIMAWSGCAFDAILSASVITIISIEKSGKLAIPYLACMALVASVYHLPPRVLPAIQAVEGGRVGDVRQDSDGSVDLGVMQINSIWIPALAAYIGQNPSSVRNRLTFDSCFNIAAAGAILRNYVNEANGDLMQGIGYYHSHTPLLNNQYQTQVTQAARLLFSPRARH